MAELKNGELVYRGKVGTGFSQAKLEQIFVELQSLKEVGKPDYAPSSKDTIWVEPELGAEVSYSEVTTGGALRDPVFKSYILQLL